MGLAKHVGAAMQAAAPFVLEDWRQRNAAAEAENLRAFKAEQNQLNREAQATQHSEKMALDREQHADRIGIEQQRVDQAGEKLDLTKAQQQLAKAEQEKALELLDTQIEAANLDMADKKELNRLRERLRETDPTDFKALSGIRNAMEGYGVKFDDENFRFFTVDVEGEYGDTRKALARGNPSTGEAQMVDLEGGTMTPAEKYLQQNPDLWRDYEAKFGRLPDWFEKPD